jgi:hypothetical protein
MPRPKSYNPHDAGAPAVGVSHGAVVQQTSTGAESTGLACCPLGDAPIGTVQYSTTASRRVPVHLHLIAMHVDAVCYAQDVLGYYSVVVVDSLPYSRLVVFLFTPPSCKTLLPGLLLPFHSTWDGNVNHSSQARDRTPCLDLKHLMSTASVASTYLASTYSYAMDMARDTKSRD